jgi:iron complex transport system ATP-binding protein
MNQLAAQHLDVGYGDRRVVEDLSLRIPPRLITTIVGANGSGKSTLLKAFSRILAPRAGVVELDGHDLHAMPSRELARRLSILPQNSQAPESLTVGELVAYGRYPHRRWLCAPSQEDAEMIGWALDVTALADLADRPVNSLSGGQQQRAWIAMTLAQGAEILLLDEPTSHLDTCHQLEVMELLADLNRQLEKTVVMVLHDLNLAARYSHHMIALKEGRIAAAGTPDEVMSERTLDEVFGITVHITRDPRTQAPICIAYLNAAASQRALPLPAARSIRP